MKLPIASLVFAASCFVFGCSSSPLDPTTQSDDGDAPVLGPTSTFAAYPAGPYGTVRGSVIENFSFSGWRHPEAAAYDITKLETVRLSDFYDPDGHTGVKLLAINASAVWCGVCRAEYQNMKSADVYANLHAKAWRFWAHCSRTMHTTRRSRKI